MPGGQIPVHEVPAFIPPDMQPDPSVPNNALPAAPTQPESPAAYDGPLTVSWLEQRLGKEQAHGIIARLLRLGSTPKRELPRFFDVPGQLDATGSAVIKLWDCPQGWYSRLHNILVALGPTGTGAGAVNPSAPIGASGVYMYLATGDQGDVNLNWGGVLAFAPTSAAGPIIPGNWTWGTKDGPILWGGQSLFLVVVGNSNASLTTRSLQVNVGLTQIEQAV